jgi:hypothetical protein
LSLDVRKIFKAAGNFPKDVGERTVLPVSNNENFRTSIIAMKM